VATAADDAKARLWDARTGHLIREFPSGVGVQAHTGVLRDVDVSPDGRFLITGSDDRTARVWDARTGDQVAVFAGYEGGVFQTRFSPREHSILTVPNQGVTALYACDACRPLDEVVKAAHRLLAVRDVSRT
jgi:WD40 repeat protein